MKPAERTLLTIPVLTPDFNTLPNYLMVMGVNEKATRAHDRRVLQIPDRETAAEFWKLYAPERIDIATLVPSFTGVSQDDLIKLTPDANWYTNDQKGRTHENSTHGRQHSLRVGLYARILAEKENLSADEIKILDATALVHDLGRNNDTVDNNHGKRSALWLEDNWKLLESHGIHLNADERSMVQLLGRCHELPYRKIPEEALVKAGILLRIFRAADALDRYRAPSEAWWPDPEQTGDIQIRDFMNFLMPFAKYFTLATEYYRLHYEPEIVKSTKIIAQGIGLIKLIKQHEFSLVRR